MSCAALIVGFRHFRSSRLCTRSIETVLCSTATFASSIRYSSTSLALRRYTGSVKAPLSPFPRRISLSLSHTHTLSPTLSGCRWEICLSSRFPIWGIFSSCSIKWHQIQRPCPMTFAFARCCCCTCGWTCPWYHLALLSILWAACLFLLSF